MKKIVVTTFIVAFIIVLIFAVLHLFGKQTLVADGDSMSPTIKDNDSFIVDEDYYKKHEVKRGDIITYKYKDGTFAKRVFGLPGEFIQTKDGEWLADGKPINKEFIFEEIPYDKNLYEGITLKDDEYFVMGDKPSVSRDSRSIGPIKKSEILGKVIEIKSK
jgi:signal peptidase I